MKIANLENAIAESFEESYGYFMYDSKTKEVIFQPTQTENSEPDIRTWDSHLHYLVRAYEFGNAERRKAEVLYSIERLIQEREIE